MKTLYESILKSTGAGAFKFTPEMLVRLGHSTSGFDTQFNVEKMRYDFNIPDIKEDNGIIWDALCHIKTGKTWKEAQKALVHSFIWDGPEDKFFKDIFKGYLLSPDKFDFFCYTEEERPGEIYVATHEKRGGKSATTRALFTFKLK